MQPGGSFTKHPGKTERVREGDLEATAGEGNGSKGGRAVLIPVLATDGLPFQS